MVDAGKTVIVIEHILEVINTADHVIDVRPEGGDCGGRIIATDTPEAIAANAECLTGRLLSHLLTPPKPAKAKHKAAG